MIRSMLVQLDAEPSCLKRLHLVKSLSKEFGATVKGVYFSPLIHPLVQEHCTDENVCSFSSTIMRSNRKRVEQEKKHIRRKIRQSFADDQVFDWTEIDGLPNENFLSTCRYNDLTIVSSEFRINNLVGKLNSSVATLATQTGGPILVVPCTYESDFKATRPLVAWDESRASSRAISDAMPFMRNAQKVTVICNKLKVAENSKKRDQQLRDYFSSHGLELELINLEADCLNPVHYIEKQITENNHDFLIMGAHGHSKVSELILGSTTRVMISHAKIPILLSH